MDDFVDLELLSPEEIADLLDLARRLEQTAKPDALRGRILGLLFLAPSLRTRSSFQAGLARLGGSSFVVEPGAGLGGIELRDGVAMEHEIEERMRCAIPALSSYVDVLGIRVPAGGRNLEDDVRDPVFSSLADDCATSVINLGSAINHPCQALGDWKTLEDLQVPGNGGKFVLSWAYHPVAVPLAVPAAVLHMAAARGMEVAVLRPEGYGLPETIMEKATRAAARSGGMIFETNDRGEAMHGAHVLYVRSWASAEHYGDPQMQLKMREGLDYWCVGQDWLASARPDVRFMHSLPVRWNVGVKDEVAGGARSVVMRQARNRMFVQMAVLYRMLHRRKRKDAPE